MPWVHRVEACITGLCVFTVVASLSIQVFLRYALNNPLPWPEEVAKFAFVWSVFFGAALGTHRGAHIAVEVLVAKFPPRLRHAVQAAVHLGVLIVLAVLVKAGWDLVRLSTTSKLPAINVPLAYLVLPVPICAGLMTLDFARFFWGSARALAAGPAPATRSDPRIPRSEDGA